MNITAHYLRNLGVFVVLSFSLAACATSPSVPEGAVAARQKLTQLKNDRALADLAPIEIQAAEQAVVAAERPEQDAALSTHLVLVADRKVDIASLWAQSRLYEQQRVALSRASEQARLDSRTREADNARRDAQIANSNTAVARDQAAAARSDAAAARNQSSAARDDAAAARNQSNIARDDAAAARSQSNVARDAAAAARSDAAIAQGATAVARDQADAAQRDAAAARTDAAVAQGATAVARDQAASAQRDADAARMETENLQRQIVELNARNTDRGLVVTLGDVLFATGQSTIVGSNNSNLTRLAVFLNRYEDRAVMIEGHTDNVGAESANMNLSQNRAEAVKRYLVSQGVAASRLSTLGKGEGSPVSSNDTNTGRQQNRRVEVIIANSAPIAAAR